MPEEKSHKDLGANDQENNMPQSDELEQHNDIETDKDEQSTNNQEVEDVDDMIRTKDLFQSNSDQEGGVLFEEDLEDYQRNLIEGALYASGEPLTVEEIYTRLDISKNDVQKYLNELIDMYETRSTALTIINIGDKYQMQIKSEYTEPISQFAEGGGLAEKYLRTLTIIALKQPILKSILVKIRGSGAYEHVQYLIDNGFLNSIKKGRTSELTTTEKYAETFGLPKNIEEMKKEMVAQLGIDNE
ncbi:MAG: SMC-Scp complex subunit ScpB [Promethearchaeati archaeon]